MPSPFPGVHPYLEHPALWPDIHNSLAAALRDALAPLVAPRYDLALARRTYTLMGDELVLIGRPDLAIVDRAPTPPPPAPARSGAAVLDVALPSVDEVSDSFLEVRDVATGTLVTVVEILSPGNKIHRLGRQDYLLKRARILGTRTNLVEIDLLRDGQPMPLAQPLPVSDYRILVSRSLQRPRAELHVFGIRDPLPVLALPLAPGDVEPHVDLTQVWQALYDRARFDLRVRYEGEPVPALAGSDREWARERIDAARS